MNREKSKRRDESRSRSKWRGWPTVLVSAAIVTFFVSTAVKQDLPLVATKSNQAAPFLFAILGVAIYAMASAKNKRDRFTLKFIPDYCFRGAQAVVYTYILMRIDESQSGANFGGWKPTMLGLFVGMFILHVERAMEGFGRFFGQVVAGVLPRSIVEQSSLQRDAQQYSNVKRLEQLRAQVDVLLPLVPTKYREPISSEVAAAEKEVHGPDVAVGLTAVRKIENVVSELNQQILESPVTFSDLAGSQRNPHA